MLVFANKSVVVRLGTLVEYVTRVDSVLVNAVVLLKPSDILETSVLVVLP